MSKAKFEIGTTYRGVSGVGECAITIVKRTEKSVWIDSVMDKNKRCQIKNLNQNEETIIYRSWIAGAKDVYTKKQMIDDSYADAYLR